MLKTLLIFLITLFFSNAMADVTSKPVKVVIPYGPGGGVDSTFRILQRYAAKNNIILVPEFRPGGKAVIGINYAAKAHHDGNTLLLTIISDVVNNNSEHKFSNVSSIATSPLVLVASTQSKIQNLKDVVKLETDYPGKLNWGSGSTVLERAIISFAGKHHLDYKKFTVIPFKGGGSMLQNILNGTIDIGYLPGNIAMPYVVNNSMTLVDNNYPKEFKDGYGLFLPTGSSDEMIKFWVKFVDAFHNDNESRQYLEKSTLIIMPSGPELMRTIIKDLKTE